MLFLIFKQWNVDLIIHVQVNYNNLIYYNYTIFYMSYKIVFLSDQSKIGVL